MTSPVVELLCELIRIPSVNPMGKNVTGPIYFEGRVTDFLESWFHDLGLETTRESVHDGRDNLYARLPGTAPNAANEPALLWEAHQDTVPVEGMSIDPFDPVIRDGRIYGRGACDIKGGMAAMLSALVRLKNEQPANLPDIVMACAINEEHGFTGAATLGRHFGPAGSTYFSQPPFAAVVAEPTDLNIVVAHKGAVRWRCETVGKAAHSSDPSRGVNAIYAMATVIGELEKIAANEVPAAAKHDRLGTPTLNVGVINGGISVNTVPDSCYVEIDRRVLPAELPAEARQQVIDALAGRLPADFQVVHHDAFIAARGLSDAANGSLAKTLSASAAKVANRGELVVAPYGTDASVFSTAGVPTVVFGPGSIEQAHTHDEWLDVAELESAVDILCDYAVNAR